MKNTQKKRVIIVGGGASGFFTAINLAVEHPHYKITILEKSSRVLAKVRISGGGRCNVTNARSKPSELVKFYPRGGKKLYKLFEQFSSSEMVDWLRCRNVETKTEADMRIFPVTDNSETIINCFLGEIRKYNIELITREGMKDMQKIQDQWHVTTTSNRKIQADNIVIATGASPSMWNLLERKGLKIEEPLPSLFTFNIHSSLLGGMQGISFDNVKLKVTGESLESDGPLLITHWGLSGPAVLKLSAWGARELNKRNYHFGLQANFIRGENPETCRDKIREYKAMHPRRKVYNYPLFNMPKRFWESLCVNSGVEENLIFGELGKKSINKLTHFLTQADFNVTGKSTFKEEFVTCGGVSLDEIDLNTFEARNFPGLYFSGEVLDIDALTGGFNFQACWSSAWVISQEI